MTNTKVDYANFNFLLTHNSNPGMNQLRPQNNLERSLLKQDLLYHGTVLSPLILNERYGIEDGWHRWELLQEIKEEGHEFKFDKIPYIQTDHFESKAQIIRTQLGRRNLSDTEILELVDLLVEVEGVSRTRAMKQIAEALEVSIGTIKRKVYPNIVEQQKQRLQLRLAEGKQQKYNSNTYEDKTGQQLTNFSTSNGENSLETNKYLDLDLNVPPTNKTTLIDTEEEEEIIKSPMQSSNVPPLVNTAKSGTPVTNVMTSTGSVFRDKMFEDAGYVIENSIPTSTESLNNSLISCDINTLTEVRDLLVKMNRPTFKLIDEEKSSLFNTLIYKLNKLVPPQL
jgi:hypothetical protein